ncbi:MFS transporter [Niallia nealsonii]|uniref:MFS transporter n=1 Tax=Niallia nealsonii TaxID=115979 RepID=A0A2N0YYJ4_9BACI|nr:MFS transporter [Niallia nealsonii]PKG22315.1 MFS transporter [Niallia nealsonii]
MLTLTRKKDMYIYIISLFAVSLNLRIGITSISPVLETIRHDLHLSNFIVSFLPSIPVLCMGIFAFFTGYATEKWGAEKAIAGCLLLIGGATFIRGIAYYTWILLITSLLIGIGIALAGPLLSGVIKKKYPSKIGVMIGIYSVGMGLGASLSAGLTIDLQQLFNQSWNHALAVWGVLAILASLLWSYAIKGGKEQKGTLNGAVKLPFKNKKAWAITIFFGIQSGIFYSATTWIASTAQSMGFTSKEAGTLVTVLAFIQMTCSFFVPILVDYLQNRNLFIYISAFLTFIGLLLLAFSLASPWTSAILIGVGIGGLFPIALMLPLNETETAEDASAWTALMQLGGYILGGTLPIVLGLIRDVANTNTQVFLVLVLLSLMLIPLILYIDRDKKNTEIAHAS